MIVPSPLPEPIRRAVLALRAQGATEIYLFGSAARGELTDRSDLDFAVRGIPAFKYFRAVGEAMAASGIPVDLIDLESDSPFARALQSRGNLRRVG